MDFGEIEITDFDKYLPAKPKSNLHPLLFQPNFGCILCGSTGSGKTNLLLNALTNWYVFDSAWIFLKDPEEDKYQLLDALYQEIQKKRPNFEYLITNDISLIPDPNQLDPKGQHFFVFDDLLTDKNSHAYIEEIAIRGRKRGISWFYLAQGFYEIPKLIRSNAMYVCLWRVDKKNLIEFYKTFGLGVDSSSFYKMFKYATDKKHNFFMIDNKTDQNNLRFRRNLDDIDIHNRF